ncbi:hypothetical protein [Mucilaginibacter sp. HD30]
MPVHDSGDFASLRLYVADLDKVTRRWVKSYRGGLLSNKRIYISQ